MQSYNGFLRDRANNNGTGILNLVISGNGTQILGLNNITYSGTTTINPGATLILDTTNNFNIGVSGGTAGSKVIINNGMLGLTTTGTFNWSRPVSGTGGMFRIGGAGTVNITGVSSFGAQVSVLEGGTTNFGATTHDQQWRLPRDGTWPRSSIVNWTSAVNILNNGGIRLLGTGDNVFDGAILNVTAGSSASRAW